MSDERARERRLSVRLPIRLVTELERVASLEANTWSAVVRRLLAAGLAREAGADQNRDRRDGESAAS
jgi:hypothetical protein